MIPRGLILETGDAVSRAGMKGKSSAAKPEILVFAQDGVSGVLSHNQHQRRPADLELGLVLQLHRLGDLGAVDERAVGRLQIFEGDDLVPHLDGGVLAGGFAVVDDQVGAGAADGDARLLETVDVPRVRAGDDGERQTPADGELGGGDRPGVLFGSGAWAVVSSGGSGVCVWRLVERAAVDSPKAARASERRRDSGSRRRGALGALDLLRGLPLEALLVVLVPRVTTGALEINGRTSRKESGPTIAERSARVQSRLF